MTVSTVPHPSSDQHKPFSTTAPNEASQFQTPKSSSNAQHGPSHVLTLHTDKAHHASMTKLRNTYFPPKLNKLDAHITLFHALPGEKLDTELIPAIKGIVSGTKSYRIRATGPFRLKAGVGISVADDIEYANKGKNGRNMTRIIHAELRKKWGNWLSDQDSRPVRAHYTVMNKVNNDQVVEKALEELEKSFREGIDVSGGHFDHETPSQSDESKVDEIDKNEKLVPEGLVRGLTLWTYDDRSGRWTNPSHFDFEG